MTPQLRGWWSLNDNPDDLTPTFVLIPLWPPFKGKPSALEGVWGFQNDPLWSVVNPIFCVHRHVVAHTMPSIALGPGPQVHIKVIHHLGSLFFGKFMGGGLTQGSRARVRQPVTTAAQPQGPPRPKTT